MAKKYYLKETQYTLPAWNIVRAEPDALYIDGDLFSNNIPVLDNVFWISVQPDAWHIIGHQIEFVLATFNRSTNTVEFLSKTFYWAPGESATKSGKVFCNGNPYGMGVNMFGVNIQIIGPTPIANPIIYDASLIMEVTV